MYRETISAEPSGWSYPALVRSFGRVPHNHTHIDSHEYEIQIKPQSQSPVGRDAAKNVP